MSHGSPGAKTAGARPAPTTPDPIEIAMEAEAAGAPPSGVAHEVLAKQSRLIGWEIADRRAAFALKVLTSAAGLVAAAVLALMAWSASRADGVIIQPFSVPPDLAARGYTGQALAARVQDRLNRLQAQTQSVRAAASYANDWGHDIKVEIPTTSVSLTDVSKALRQWLGHESHVGGDLVRTPTGLSLTVRTEAGGDDVAGDEADMDGLLQKAAEALYRRTQPYRFGEYLRQANRIDEAKAVFADLAENGPPSERPWGLTGMARLEQDPVAARRLASQALALNPNLANAWRSYALAAQRSGDYEAAYRANARALALYARPDRGGTTPEAQAELVVRADFHTYSGHFADCLTDSLKGERAATKPGQRAAMHGSAIYCTGLTHDISGMRRMTGGVLDGESIQRGTGGQHEWNAALTTHDWERGLAASRSEEAVLQASPDPAFRQRGAERIRPQQAMYLARLGRLDEARAAIAGLDPNGYWASAARGFIAEAEGDAAKTDRIYEAVITRMPHVAWTYSYWGEARLRRGDAAGAVAVADRGLKLAPRNADLMVIRAEGLLRQGRAAAALKSLDTAARLTPRWGLLHMKRGEALAKLGKLEGARAEYRIAAGLDLASEDRVSLQRLSR